ncbi:MAG: sigma factor, partial [Pseudomonadota bacterium]
CHQVDELVQQALITVYAKRAAWDPARPFLQWLTAIAQYRWADHLEQGYRQCNKELTRGRVGSDPDPAPHPR